MRRGMGIRRLALLLVALGAPVGVAVADEAHDAWTRIVGGARPRSGQAPFLAVEGFGFGVLREVPSSDYVLRFRYRQGRGVGVALLPAPETGATPRLHQVQLRDDAIVLLREHEGRLEEFAAAGPGLAVGAWHDVAIVRRGPSLEVSVGGQLRVSGEDARGLATGRVALGALVGSGFAFEEVRLEAAPEQPTAMPPEAEGRYLGTDVAAARASWRLSGGSRLVGEAVREVEVPPGGEAAWGAPPVEAGSLTFRLRGHARVNLGRTAGGATADGAGGQDLVLVVSGAGLALQVEEGRKTVPLGEVTRAISPTVWQDIAVHAERTWIQIDLGYGPALTAAPPAPVALGPLALRAADAEAHVADVRLVPWPAGRVSQIRGLLEGRSPGGSSTPTAPVGAALPATGPRDVPLHVAQYRYGAPWARLPARIDPGPLPPNFVHTWVIDVRGIDFLELPTKGLAQIALGPEDRITLYDLAGLAQSPATPLGPPVTRASRSEDLRFDLRAAKTVTARGETVRRIFLQVETSASEAPRRLRLEGFRNGADNDGDEEVLLLADEIDAGGNVIWASTTPTGLAKDIPSPFKPGTHTGFNSYPQPSAADGWYLLARNLSDASTHFFSLAYYNERLGLLRLLLYNLDMPLAVSGTTVTVSLRGFSGATAAGSAYVVGEPLEGAFFPLHPNPGRWSSATVPLVEWHLNSWAALEIPVAYPMGKNLAVDASRASAQPAGWYRSLYEEPLLEGRRGVLLQLSLDSYDAGTWSGEWHGKAVGSAIQKAGAATSGGPGLIDLAKAAAKAGGDIFKGARAIYDGIKGYRDELKKDGNLTGDVFKHLGSLLSMGSSVFSGGFGIAGAAYEFISGLFGGKPKPLELSLQMELAGSLSGSVKIEHTQGPVWRCYLPGRFPVAEAYGLGLHADDPAVLAASAPAYDRTLGLFGWRYDPAELRFRVLRGDGDPTSDAKPVFLFPASATPDPARGWLDAVQAHLVLDRFLPVVHNPYAEILPAKAALIGSEVVEEKPSHPMAGFAPPGWWKRTRWLFDDSWATHVVPEPGDAGFPRQTTLHAHDTIRRWVEVRLADPYRLTLPAVSSLYDYTLDFEDGLVVQVAPSPGYAPPSYRAFQAAEARNIDVAPWYAGFVANEDVGGADPSLPRAFDSESLHPLENVVFHWTQRYFWYGRSRQAPDGSVPRYAGTAHFRSPVTVEVRRLVGAPAPGAKAPVLHVVKSALLR